MTASPPEFTRLVPLARLGAEPLVQEIAASEAERAALARRFGLLTLDRLSARVELARQGDEVILLNARFEAEFVQECVVSLDPLPGAVCESFALRYGPPEAEAGFAAVEDDIAFEPLSADMIDIGEAVAQEFSLALPSFPRRRGAVIEEGTAAPTPGEHPFAALHRLATRNRGGE